VGIREPSHESLPRSHGFWSRGGLAVGRVVRRVRASDLLKSRPRIEQTSATVAATVDLPVTLAVLFEPLVERSECFSATDHALIEGFELLRRPRVWRRRIGFGLHRRSVRPKRRLCSSSGGHDPCACVERRTFPPCDSRAAASREPESIAYLRGLWPRQANRPSRTACARNGPGTEHSPLPRRERWHPALPSPRRGARPARGGLCSR
jgi:hypothetical protein